MWFLSAKKRVKAARSPLASMPAAYRGQKRIRGRLAGSGRLRPAQAEDIPTMGLFRVMPPVDP